MDNPEKLAIYGTQDEEKQNKNTTQCVLDTTMLRYNEFKIILRCLSLKNVKIKYSILRNYIFLDNNNNMFSILQKTSSINYIEFKSFSCTYNYCPR